MKGVSKPSLNSAFLDGGILSLEAVEPDVYITSVLFFMKRIVLMHTNRSIVIAGLERTYSFHN